MWAGRGRGRADESKRARGRINRVGGFYNTVVTTREMGGLRAQCHLVLEGLYLKHFI